jgi:hypothetical protein
MNLHISGVKCVASSMIVLFDIVNYALLGLILLGLYAALRRADIG